MASMKPFTTAEVPTVKVRLHKTLYADHETSMAGSGIVYDDGARRLVRQTDYPEVNTA